MRERRSFTRPSGKREARLVIIATEGAITEKAYFEGLVSADGFPNSQVHVEVLATEAGESAPKKVIGRLNEFKRQYRLDQEDQLWLVVDKDRWPDAQLAEVAQQSHQKGYFLALSNPCFELWLWLHWVDPSQQNIEALRLCWENAKVSASRRHLEAQLSTLAGGYQKTKPDFRRYYPRVPQAQAGAQWLDADGGGRWPAYLATRVYQVVAAVMPSPA